MSASPQLSPLGRGFAILASVAVVATLVAAFLVMRSPGEQRQVNLDLRRVQDLVQVGNAVDQYARVHGRLPDGLATLAAQPGSLLPTRDPVTDSGYEYAPGSDLRYRLCAVFDTDTARTGEAAPFGPRNWTHGKGRQCFERRAPRVQQVP